MTSADEWFQQGMKAVEMSHTADYHSEYVGDLESAVAAFDQVIALQPAHLEALRERGLALAILKRHEAALDSFVAAASLAPADADLHLAVGQSLEQLGRRDAALGAYDEVLRLRPDDEEALYRRADQLTELQLDEAALPAWAAVLSAKDNKTLTLSGRTVRVLTGDFRRLHARLSQALVLGRLGHPEAAEAFRALLEASGDKLSGPSGPSLFPEALRTLEVARSAFRDWLGAHPADSSAWRLAAEAWSAARLPAEAMRAWDRVVALAPTAQSWFGKAEAHAQAGQLEEAIACYERSLALWPGFLGASARLAVVKDALSQKG